MTPQHSSPSFILSPLDIWYISFRKMCFYTWMSQQSENKSESQDYQCCAGKAKILKKHEVKHIQGHTSPSKLLSDTWQCRQKLERSCWCMNNFVWGTRRTWEHTHRGLRDTDTWVTWVCARVRRRENDTAADPTGRLPSMHQGRGSQATHRSWDRKSVV